MRVREPLVAFPGVGPAMRQAPLVEPVNPRDAPEPVPAPPAQFGLAGGAVDEVAALSLIGELYRQEKTIRKKKLEGPAKLAHRRERAAPAVDAFFAWCRQQRQRVDLLPSSPFGQALAYAAEREAGLRVFLEDPGVAIDTNHLERGLRPIPMGRRNWLFAWTELGARRVGAIQSLLATCQLQRVNPYIYLVDVLQRIDRHPARRAVELTPRMWKTRFADNPLRSDLDRARDPPLQ